MQHNYQDGGIFVSISIEYPHIKDITIVITLFSFNYQTANQQIDNQGMH